MAQVAYKDQVACLSTPTAPGACELKVTGGGIYRIVGRRAPLSIKGAPAAVVDKITTAAEHAFYQGLHTAMLASGAILFMCAIVAWVLLRAQAHGETPAQLSEAPRRSHAHAGARYAR